MRRAVLKPRSPEKELYRFLEAYRRREGRFPSYREIGAAMGWKSTNTVSARIRRLVDQGLLMKEPGKARSFTLSSYRRGRYLDREMREVEVRDAAAGDSRGRTVWIDRGWFGGKELAVWQVTGLGPFVEGILPGDHVIIDRAKKPVLGDLAAVTSGDELLVGILFFRGSSPRLRISVDPDEELLLGEGTLAGEVLGKVVGVLRRT